MLSLLSEAAEERPLLCVVDDAQWLDSASAQTLAFVGTAAAGRAAWRSCSPRASRATSCAACPRLDVSGVCGERTTRARCSVRSVRFLLDERVRDRIVAETRGNPLALLELPRGLTATQLAGGFGLLGAQALPGRIEESFERRLEALPEDTRRCC